MSGVPGQLKLYINYAAPSQTRLHTPHILYGRLNINRGRLSERHRRLDIQI